MLNRINISELARAMAEGINQAVLTDLANLVTEDKPTMHKTSHQMGADIAPQTLAGVAV
jgi:hypothetical protein